MKILGGSWSLIIINHYRNVACICLWNIGRDLIGQSLELIAILVSFPVSLQSVLGWLRMERLCLLIL